MESFAEMSTSLKFLTVGFFASILLYFINAAIAIFYVLPLLLKEAGVKNGLVKLRRQMLAEVVLYIAVSVFSIFALTGRFIFGTSEVSRYIIVSMVFLTSISFTAKILIYKEIYNQTFSDEQKKLHELMAKLEKKLKK